MEAAHGTRIQNLGGTMWSQVDHQQSLWLQKIPNVNLWQPATVIFTPEANISRSYVISTAGGSKYRRNRLMLQE